MTPTNEAVCLLQSGAMYPRRVGLRTRLGEDLFFGIKTGAFSIYQGDEPIYHFDLDGRWQRVFLQGVHYLKGLDGSVQSVDRDREGQAMILRRRTLEISEVRHLDQSIRQAIDDLDRQIASGEVEKVDPPPSIPVVELSELRESLQRVIGWDDRAWTDHRARYQRTYSSCPFLPPDCSNPIVIQSMVGRVFGQPDPVPTQPRTLDEFDQHIEDVRQLLGRRVVLSRQVFLAGLDVLRRPVDRIVLELDRLNQNFPERDIQAFLDDFGPGLPDESGWASLRDQGLKRVTLGIESGDPTIRSRFGKTWTEPELFQAVNLLRNAGISLGVVVLAGLGEPSHVEATARLIGALPIGERDLITVTEARGRGDDSSEVAAMKRALGIARGSKGGRVVAYNPEKSWT